MAAARRRLAVPGAVVAALAFFLSQRNQRRGATDWLVRRERLLGIGIGIVAIAFLVAAIGAMKAAGASPETARR